MIINIKGTSGSGKSTLVRHIMDLYDNKEPIFKEGRKQPIAYELSPKSTSQRNLIILGHYETACGGCDTLKTPDLTLDLVRHYADLGYDVIFEGLMLTADTNRTKKLHEDGYPLTVIHLDLPLELCLESIVKRRHKQYVEKCVEVDNWNAANPNRKQKVKPEQPKPVNPVHTTGKWRNVKAVMVRLCEAGVNAYSVNRQMGYEIAKHNLGFK